MLREDRYLSIVIPVFNEEESIKETLCRLQSLRDTLVSSINIEFIFIDDGSTDSSLTLLKTSASKHPHIKVISFSRNFGHQIAITAGIDLAKGDYVAVIDADLQDAPELIEDMYHLAQKGYDIP